MSYDKLTALSEMEHIRLRMGTWIGDNSTADHLFSEVIDNAIDEGTNGHAKNIRVEFHNEDTAFSISDDGRGFPQGKDENGADQIELAVTKLFAGGKYDQEAYASSGGLNGVGLTVCNALSREFRITTWRANLKNQVHAVYENGVLMSRVEGAPALGGNGSCIFVDPNPELFGSTAFDLNKVNARLRLIKTFNPDVGVFLNQGEIEAYTLAELIGGEIDTECLEFKVTEEETGDQIWVRMGYDLSRVDTKISGTINNIPVDEGTHIRVAETIVGKAWGSVVDGKKVIGSDTLIGLRAHIYCKLAEPNYGGQNKETLRMRQTYFKNHIEVASAQLKKVLESKAFAGFRKALITKFEDYRKSMTRMSSSKYLDSVLEMGGTSDKVQRGAHLGSKLQDCTNENREGTELFLVEGNSAGGSLLKTRDSRIHAVLPLRGKVLNVVDQDMTRIMSNLEIRSFANALGSGVTVKEDVEQLRYDYVNIAADADVDGMNIRALLIGAMAYLTPKLLESGRVRVVLSPTHIQIDKNGNRIPIFDEKDLIPKLETRRIKGLGELSPIDAKPVFFSEHRRVIPLGVEDVKRVLETVGTGHAKKKLLIKNQLAV